MKEKSIKKPDEKYTFQWVYKNPHNKNIITTGEMEAVSVNTVKVNLRNRGMDVKYVTIKKENVSFFANKIKPVDLVVLLRQMSTLQNAGVSLVESFMMLSMTLKGHEMKKMIKKIILNLNSGESLSSSLALFPKYFDHITLNLIKAGEQGGMLDEVLRDIAEYKEKDFALKKKIKSALMYPGITIVVMLVVVIILMTTVIPTFAKLFKSFNSQLPFLTQVVVDVSNWMASHVLYLVLIPTLVISLLMLGYKRSPAVRWNIDRLTLRIPIINKMLLNGATARFMKTLALLNKAGVPIQESMQTLSTISGNTVIDTGISKARDNVLAGGTIADGLKNTYLPDMAVRLLAIGELSGKIEVMAQKTGEHYENEVNEMVDRMSTLLEPFIMIFLGIVIGTIVIAMFLPMLDIGSAILHSSGVN